jgi:hypothetical protein
MKGAGDDTGLVGVEVIEDQVKRVTESEGVLASGGIPAEGGCGGEVEGVGKGGKDKRDLERDAHGIKFCRSGDSNGSGLSRVCGRRGMEWVEGRGWA